MTMSLLKAYQAKEIAPAPINLARQREPAVTLPTHLFQAPNRPVQRPAYILIVDDCSPIVDILSRMLSAAGYRLATAASGLEAIEKTWFTQPDLILLDVSLPDLTGYEVWRNLKHKSRTAHIPITFMSVVDDGWYVKTVSEPANADFITKPIHYTALVDRVERQLRQNRRSMSGLVGRKM